MIELYYWPTPNGHKITIFLEEAALPYRIVPVDISAGDQFKPEFLAISPNNRMPAIIDHAPADGGAPISVFESGAILVYLAEKIGRFLPTALRSRKTVFEWLFWQVGGLGPMAGQNHHFVQYAPEPRRFPQPQALVPTDAGTTGGRPCLRPRRTVGETGRGDRGRESDPFRSVCGTAESGHPPEALRDRVKSQLSDIRG